MRLLEGRKAGFSRLPEQAVRKKVERKRPLTLNGTLMSVLGVRANASLMALIPFLATSATAWPPVTKASPTALAPA